MRKMTRSEDLSANKRLDAHVLENAFKKATSDRTSKMLTLNNCTEGTRFQVKQLRMKTRYWEAE